MKRQQGMEIYRTVFCQVSSRPPLGKPIQAKGQHDQKQGKHAELFRQPFLI
jgi:hypothetical protein